MGVPSSKHSGNEAVVLCRERTQYIKQAIDSRYALSAAHLTYIQSLRSVGTALRRFVEAEFSVEPSISTLEPDRTPSISSYASSSPLPIAENIGSPLHPPRLSNVSYMRAPGNAATVVTVCPPAINSVKEADIGSSWDFFHPNDNGSKAGEVVPFVAENLINSCRCNGEVKFGADESLVALIGMASGELHRSSMVEDEMVRKELYAEREDASEFITHRAKDFLSSMKDIEHRFFRAAESGNEVSRLLETRKIRLSITSEIIGKSPSCQFLSTFQDVCCKAETIFKHESGQKSAKVVTWNRSISSISSSSSSKSPLEPATKDISNESDCSFTEEFCMIAGSHSSTLDRLYAWERKLYEEVNASESLMKGYDQTCSQLRHQFARNLNAQDMDRTRVAAKDLHSQISVAIQAVNSISKKIERIRDEELQPQIMELMHGLIRMWKAMLECHHTQFITISLAYHVVSSKPESRIESFNEALSHVLLKMDCFASSFAYLVEAHKSYMEAINSWLHKCILRPQEPSKGRRTPEFNPHRSLSLPPIFVLCQQWLNGIKSLQSEELHDSFKGVISILHNISSQQIEERWDKDETDEAERLCERWSLDGLQAGLTRVFDRLAKFSESSLKVFEDVRQANETAFIEYYTSIESNCKTWSGERVPFQKSFRDVQNSPQFPYLVFEKEL